MEFLTEKYVRFMTGLTSLKSKLAKNERGQTLVEYALLLVLIAIVVILAVTFVGRKTCNVYMDIGNRLTGG